MALELLGMAIYALHAHHLLLLLAIEHQVLLVDVALRRESILRA